MPSHRAHINHHRRHARLGLVTVKPCDIQNTNRTAGLTASGRGVIIIIISFLCSFVNNHVCLSEVNINHFFELNNL